jgi:hypothetical protein
MSGIELNSRHAPSVSLRRMIVDGLLMPMPDRKWLQEGRDQNSIVALPASPPGRIQPKLWQRSEDGTTSLGTTVIWSRLRCSLLKSSELPRLAAPPLCSASRMPRDRAQHRSVRRVPQSGNLHHAGNLQSAKLYLLRLLSAKEHRHLAAFQSQDG